MVGGPEDRKRVDEAREGTDGDWTYQRETEKRPGKRRRKRLKKGEAATARSRHTGGVNHASEDVEVGYRSRREKV